MKSEIPAGWVEASLRDVADWFSGGTPRTSVAEYWNGETPWITAKSLKSFHLWDSDRKVTDAGLANGTRLMPPGSILFVVRGMSLKSEFRIGVARRPLAFGQDCKALIVREDVDNYFLAYVLRGRANEILGLVDEASHGTGRLSTDALQALQIALPPLPEQRRISAILCALDDKIELNRKMNQTLEEMVQAIFKSWFIDFDDHQPADLVDSELGPIPKEWEIGTLEECTDVIIDHRGKTPKKLGGNWSTTGFPAISAKNVKEGRLVRRDTIRHVDESLYKRWMKVPLKPWDVVMTSEAPLGELFLLSGRHDFCLSQRLYGIRAGGKLASPFFLYCWLGTHSTQAEMEGRASGTTVRGIRQSELRKVNVLLPPIAEQLRFSETSEPIFRTIQKNTDESSTLNDLRDTLLPKLISGDVRVSEAEAAVGAAL